MTVGVVVFLFLAAAWLLACVVAYPRIVGEYPRQFPSLTETQGVDHSFCAVFAAFWPMAFVVGLLPGRDPIEDQRGENE